MIRLYVGSVELKQRVQELEALLELEKEKSAFLASMVAELQSLMESQTALIQSTYHKKEAQ